MFINCKLSYHDFLPLQNINCGRATQRLERAETHIFWSVLEEMNEGEVPELYVRIFTVLILSSPVIFASFCFTMADRYAGGYDLDPFGNHYQGSSTNSFRRQGRQHYVDNGGPTREDYDPSRVSLPTVNNSTGRIARSASHSHHTLMPSSGRNNGIASQSARIGIPQVQGLGAFDPLPIGGNATLYNLNPNVRPPSLSNRFDSRPISKSNEEVWLEKLEMTVSGLSLEPMKGSAILLRLKKRTAEVTTRYLPCVDFLVQCQQELRKGLAAAKRTISYRGTREGMTPQQFYERYISNLPSTFYMKNQRIMEIQNLDAAFKELERLCADARAVDYQGCEIIKSTFLGGMKDGESWGLRKWLSKHGGALQICNDCECILSACQKLDRSLESTKKLGEKFRPLADKALKRLKNDVPSSYQEQSSAHPYLPFFHRLESALRGMSNFDPEDDDVICIDDDDEVEAIKSKVVLNDSPKKRRAQSAFQKPIVADDYDNIADDNSVIQMFGLEERPSKKAKKNAFEEGDDGDIMKHLLNSFDDSNDIFGDEVFNWSTSGKKDSFDLADGLERLAREFDTSSFWKVRPNDVPMHSFWDASERYAGILRLFCEVLRNPDAAYFLDTENMDESYSMIIKHPLSFRQIVSALMEEEKGSQLVGSKGLLPAQSLANWNMWRGNDLFQAIDLVFLNSLAHSRASADLKSNVRSKTNKLRKFYWEGIKRLVDAHVGMDTELRRRNTPTRRGESSGFVIHKYS